MNNVTNVTRSISTYGLFDQNGTTGPEIASDPYPLLTLLHADSLISLDELFILGVPTLNLISMSNLELVNRLTVYSTPTMRLNFPQLNNSSNIRIQGSYSSLNFDRLVDVNESLVIATTNDTWVDFGGSDSIHDISSPIDIKLPSLINVMYIELWGNISSLYTPNLTTANIPNATNPSSSYVETGISIQNLGPNPLDINLPELYNASKIFMGGTLGSVSLSSLAVVFKGYPSNDSYIDISEFTASQPGGYVIIKGNVASIDISSFPNIGSPLDIFPDDSFDCNSLGAGYANIKGSTQDFNANFHRGRHPIFQKKKKSELDLQLAY
ncbi:hypothetical protein N431DRAFT_458963 [Stipitochalara longipes BDJ]|nr:hypothetical protein N431DRAFT_458963 [Stipitochalara longipes BDJ]